MKVACPLVAGLLLVGCDANPPMQKGGSEQPSAVAEQTGTTVPAGARPGEPDRVVDQKTVRQQVEELGSRLAEVALLAPPETVRSTIRNQYARLATPELLEKWLSSPDLAPGRTVSSPWPSRIDIIRVRKKADDENEVFGEIVEVTSTGDVTRRIPVSIGFRLLDDEWRVSSWSPSVSSFPGATIPARGAVAVIESYYDAIDHGDYRRAWEFWESGGRASGQSFEEFVSGFSETATVNMRTGEPGRVEPAAGSRWIEVPVEIEATTRDGDKQRFRGVYTLRYSVIEDAVSDPRRWQIHSAEIARIR